MMSSLEAYRNVEKACESLTANWQVHQLLRQSLQILQDLVMKARENG